MNLVSDAGLLDHVHAQLLPILTSLEAHLQDEHEQTVDFVVTETFAPAQKNERQLDFCKIKHSGSNRAQSHFKSVYQSCYCYNICMYRRTSSISSILGLEGVRYTGFQ